MEQEVIADIARRVKKTQRYTETAELMAKSMVEQGYSADKIRAEVMKVLRADKEYEKAVAENTKAYKQKIQDIIDETLKRAEEAGELLIEEAGNMAWNNDLSMWQEHGVDLKKPNSMKQLMDAFKEQTVGELKNLTRSMGFKNTVLGKTGVLQTYQREMDLAVLKVATGTFSYDQAVNDCIKRLAQSGLRSIDYASGRTYQLDTAARMCVRTGASQLAGRITEMNLKSTGQDLVITSQHMGSRPQHVPIQNRVFSFSGKNKKYPDFQAPIGKGGAGYGLADGIKGTNCTHDFFPYWEGDYIPQDVEPNEEYYKNTQKQRAMERGIRATKREIEAQKAIGGNTKELRAKLKKQTADYHAFSEKVGIRAKDNRLRVVGGTSKLNLRKSNKNIRRDYLRNNLPKNFKDPRKIGKIISKEQLEKFNEKAKNYGIRLIGFENYCGNITILDEILEHTKYSIEQLEIIGLHKMDIIIKYDNVLGYLGDNSKIDIGAFGITNGKTITLNKFMFDDSVYMKQEYDSMINLKYIAKGTSYINIIDHEIGHMISKKNPQLYNIILAKIEKLAYNENKSVIDFIRENISEYAAFVNEKGVYSELISELYSMLHGQENDFAKKFFS